VSGTLAACVLGLAVAAVCACDPGDGLGGAVHAEWRVVRAGAPGRTGAKPDTTVGAKRDTGAKAAGMQGSMRGAGAVVWCAGPKLAIVTGVQGDTGLGLVIHPRDSLAPGVYPVLPPDSARTTAPAAAVALRLMSRTAVEGYQGTGGKVTVTKVGDHRLSGELRAEAQVVGAVQRLELEGEFRDLPIRVGGPACGV
jgi:hypothetical protein